MVKKKQKLQGIEAPPFNKVFDAVCAAIKTYPLVCTKYNSIRVRVTNDFKTIVLSGQGPSSLYIFLCNGGKYIKRFKANTRLEAFRITFFFYQTIRKQYDVSVLLKETENVFTVTVNKFPMLRCSYKSGLYSIDDLQKEQELLQTEFIPHSQEEIEAHNYGIHLSEVLSNTSIPKEMSKSLPTISMVRHSDGISLVQLTTPEKKAGRKGGLYYHRLMNPNLPDTIPAPKIVPGRSTIRKVKPQPVSLEGTGIPDRYDHDD